MWCVKKSCFSLISAAVMLAFSAYLSPAEASSRIKDIADFEGVRDNQLVAIKSGLMLAAGKSNLKTWPR